MKITKQRQDPKNMHHNLDDVDAMETYQKSEGTVAKETEPEKIVQIPETPGYLYSQHTIASGTRSSKVHVLEILKSDAYCLEPVLSFDMVFGYRLLSEMLEDEGAVTGVNGGFSYIYGRHGGVFIKNGRYYNWKTGEYPVLVQKDKAYSFFLSADFDAHVVVNGETVKLQGINKPHEYMSNVILYNPLYGKTDRIDGEHFVVRIADGVIESAGIANGEQDIPRNGYLLTIGQPYTPSTLHALYVVGKKVEVITAPQLGPEDWAYECGDMLVLNGENVAPVWSGWVGTLEGYDPRTAVGINNKGNPVFVVVDGRQAGYSDGVTAKELANIMIGLGIRNGAMLDGGATSEMIIDRKIVNRPSYQGLERPMASAFIILKRD